MKAQIGNKAANRLRAKVAHGFIFVMSQVFSLSCAHASGPIPSVFELTRDAELIVLAEVVECRTNGSYQLRSERTLKGVCQKAAIELPFRYFYQRSTETKELSLACHERALFFLRYTVNGDGDALYCTMVAQLKARGLDSRRIPYAEGYEAICGVPGVQKRASDSELTALADTVPLTMSFLKDKSSATWVRLFNHSNEGKMIALDALDHTKELFDKDKKTFGTILIKCLSDADPQIGMRAAVMIRRGDYREATAALQSHTNSPVGYFRETVVGTLKTFEMRTPKEVKTSRE